jgi:hypothetical protein
MMCAVAWRPNEKGRCERNNRFRFPAVATQHGCRPVPGDCGLLARFIKAETLLVLTLWRIYHDVRMEQAVEAVVVTANDIWQQLKLYFEQIELPTPAQLRDMLGTLRRRRLVRVRWHEEASQFGESQIEIRARHSV